MENERDCISSIKFYFDITVINIPGVSAIVDGNFNSIQTFFNIIYWVTFEWLIFFKKINSKTSC